MAKHILLVLLALAMLLSASGATANDDIRVAVTLDRDRIGMDEQAILEIVVNGTSQDIPPPNLPTLSMFEMYNQGRSTNISWVNGVMTSSVTYRYALLPTKAGTFPIRNIAVVYQNKRYKGNDVELTVLDRSSSVPQQLENKAKDQDGRNRSYFLEAEVDKKNPYVNQQVTLTLKIYIGVRHSTPELSWPAHIGFWREALGRSTTYTQKINNRTYQVYEIKSALFPTQTGDLEIGQGQFTAAVGGGFFRVGETISARSIPMKIKVKPLPVEGKPADFTGTIGKLKMSATVDKTQVEVNQPVTVTVRMQGTGNIKSVAEPAIPEMEEFRVYQASAKENLTKTNNRVGGTKIFEEVFVPRRAGDLKIPALSYNFFNPTTGKYEYLKTRPIPIRVTPGEGYAASEEVPYAPASMSIGSQATDIRYIKSDIGDMKPVGTLSIFSLTYWLVNGVPVVLLVGMIAFRMRQSKLIGDVGYARSRAASKLARKRLVKAKGLARTATVIEFYAEISLALTSFVADKLNISPYGLTSDRIAELLTGHGADEQLVDNTVDLLQKSDFARFASSSITQEEIDASLAATEETMTRLGEISYA